MPENILRVLAFDFGMKRIGVAFGQTVTKSAKALPCLSAKDGIPQWDDIQKLITTWQANTLLVGLPTTMDDKPQFTTHAAKKFSNRLKERFSLPVFNVDERLSTKAARELVFEEGGYKALQQTAIDSIAAQLFLEQWLRQQGDT